MSDEVLVEHLDGMVIVTINRPAQRNAVNRAVSYGVCEAIDEMDRNPDLRIGILTGATLRHSVSAGQTITLSDVDIPDSVAKMAWESTWPNKSS